MAGTVKGITIEFRGDTTKLSRAIGEVRKETRDLDKELGYIDNSLKFNPGNLDLIKQKMTVLEQAADKAGDNADDLKKALDQMKADGVDETSTEYRELEREIIRAESKQKDYNKQLDELKRKSSTLGQVATKIGEFGSKAEAAGKALAPISAAAGAVDLALAGLAYKSGKAADDLNTLSTQTGISTEDLQKYAAAADLVDVPLETMTKSQVKLTKSMSAAKDGSKKQAEAFDKLGVAVTDSNGELRDAGDVFDDTIKALGKMENPTERNALAQKIFGKNASELNSLIADGGKTYAQVAKVYEDNDLSIVDQETLDKANEFNDALDTIKMTGAAALSKVGTQLAAYLAPAMEKVSAALSKIMGFISNLDPQILTVIGIIAGVVAALAPLLIVIGKVATGISAIMTVGTKLGPLLTGLAGPVGIAIAIFAALVAAGVLIYKNWDKIKAATQKMADAVKKAWNDLKTAITTAVDAIKTSAVNGWNAVKTGVVNSVNALKTSVVNVWNTLKTSVVSAVNNTKTGVVNAWNALKTSVSNTVTTLVSNIKSLFSFDLKLPEIKLPSWSDIKAKLDDIITKIKGLFNWDWKLPDIKLPHFSVTGGEAPYGLGGKGSLPKISIHWYKRAYDDPMMFTSPTVLATPQGYKGFGDGHGAEIVLGLNKLRELVGASSGSTVINVYPPAGANVQEIAAAVEQRLVAAQQRRMRVYA